MFILVYDCIDHVTIAINFHNWLFMKDVTDIVKNVLIMSFLVIIASLIAFMILIIIEKMLIFIERTRNQKVDIISDWCWYIHMYIKL